MEFDISLERTGVTARARVTTDQPSERLEVMSVARLPGAQFWRVEHSARCWSMLHDTFTAYLVRGPAALSARWSSRGREQGVSPGGVLLMAPGDVHRLTLVSEPASFFAIWWPPGALCEAAVALGGGPVVRFFRPQSESPALAAALLALCTVLEGDGSPLAVDVCFAEATSRVLEHAAQPNLLLGERNAHHPSVRRVLEYLHDALAENISLDHLASVARLSKFHLARSFRETVGVPPHQYLSLLRLQAARRHLERGVSVEESAALVGFADGPHLTRAFRRWLGVSPGSWSRATRCVSVPPPSRVSASSPRNNARALFQQDRSGVISPFVGK